MDWIFVLTSINSDMTFADGSMQLSPRYLTFKTQSLIGFNLTLFILIELKNKWRLQYKLAMQGDIKKGVNTSDTL